MNLRKHFDAGSLLVIAITLALFVFALFAKGFTHDLLLEAGVFLVSVKLILMGYKSSISNNSIWQKLDEIHTDIQQQRRPLTLDSTLPSTGSSNGDRPSSGTSDLPIG
jgi:hypothetical protein